MIIQCHACKKDFEINRKSFNRRNKNKIGIFCTPECTRIWQTSSFQEERKKNPKFKESIYKDNLKKCSACQQFFPVEEFGARGINVTGLKQSHCRLCFSSIMCKRYNAKKLAAVKYLGGHCMICKQVFPAQAFNFHHRDPSTKKFDWGKLKLQSVQNIIIELDKCDLLCGNCHTIEHSGSKNWEGLESDAERFLIELKNGGVKTYKKETQMSTVNCVSCQNSFTVPTYTIRKGFGKYCSRQCTVNSIRKADHSQVIIRFTETKNYSLVGREFGMCPNNVKKIVRRSQKLQIMAHSSSG